jgi:hypothetical protein
MTSRNFTSLMSTVMTSAATCNARFEYPQAAVRAVVAADRIGDESGCVLRYQRTFMRPLLPGGPSASGYVLPTDDSA